MTKKDLKAEIEIAKALKCKGDCKSCSKNYEQCLIDLRGMVNILFRLICKKDDKKDKLILDSMVS
ncbi:MAG: hypothetical protein V3V14_12160 [Saprospiraceae bacterium]